MMSTTAKKCPTCQTPMPAEQMVCKCGYDFTMMDCPGCDARIPDDSAICPHCKYDLVDDVPAGKKKEKPKPKPKPEVVEERIARTVAVSRRKERVYVPGLHNMMHWEELTFKGPETDDGMMLWVHNLRKRSEADNMILMNHAIGYIAEQSDSKYLRTNAMRLRDLLGGDDWK